MGEIMVSVEDLKKQALLEEMDNESLGKIASLIKEVSFKAGRTVFKENEDTEGLYLIHSGKLEISKTTADGWKQTLAVFGPGNFCGELSIFDEHERSATVEAVEETSILKLRNEAFDALLRDYPEIG
ncbi:MAG: cyclic nucleotide-binding domain-containing protein, partial [Nitrospirales bacterium]|nr:cyclic nucleotide-binding domain-containing protein [Nitrospirales bacterium]